MRKEIKARYVLDASNPLFSAFWLEWQRCASEPERGLTAYCLLALNDRLVADLGLDFLFSRLRRAPADLRVTDVLGFIKAAATIHSEVTTWTDTTLHRVCQHYCASIRDFGLAKGMVRKTTVRPALYGSPTRLLVRTLRLADARDHEIPHAPVFRLLGLQGTEVIDALGELNRQGALRFRMQGDVVELDVGGNHCGTLVSDTWRYDHRIRHRGPATCWSWHDMPFTDTRSAVV
ncbi:MAG: DUF1819 family protein [Deltaproteobacteria bacterium]|nr:DUF1819 family protein [Deltaproteobacteria bacterium]